MSVTCQRCQNPNADEAKFCLHCGAMIEQARADTGDPLIGRVLLGRYRIDSVLGEGGMGKVYLAEQKMGAATRKVAIKTLHPELSGDPQLVARFHRESETVIELSHPNTIQFYDFGELEDDTLIIVMEYIEGEDLAHVLQRGALDPARADKLLIQICGSLHEAHQRGIVHRDLKPENILLTDRGGQTDFVKVLDFGIAKRSEAEDQSSAKLTKQGMVLGTPPYMSPEQFSGQALDARSDIYSLAVMAYEMLAGSLPFEANTPWEWATKHLTAEPAPFESHPHTANLPPQKKNAVMRALSKNRDQRHSTVLEFLQELTGYQDAQAAWTMATSAGALMSTPGHAQPRGPIGTPGPMPQSGGHPQVPYQTPTPALRHDSHGHGGQDSYGGYGSGSMGTVSTGGGAGKIIAVVVIALFIMGGGAAGGLYWWSQQGSGSDMARDTPVQAQAPVGTSSPPQQHNPMVPTTPDPVEPVQGNGDQQAAEERQAREQAREQAEREAEEEAARQAAEREAAERAEREEEERAARTKSGPSARDVARARSLVSNGDGALDRNDIDGAINALAQARRLVGGRHSTIRSLQSDLARKGSNKVGILMQQGRCPDAQQLYRRLRSVGASGPSSQHFSGDWCPRP